MENLRSNQAGGNQHSPVADSFSELCALRNALGELGDELVEDDNLLAEVIESALFPARIVACLQKCIEDITVLPSGDSLNGHDGVLAATCIDLAIGCIEILRRVGFQSLLSQEDVSKLEVSDTLYRRLIPRFLNYRRGCFISISETSIVNSGEAIPTPTKQGDVSNIMVLQPPNAI